MTPGNRSSLGSLYALLVNVPCLQDASVTTLKVETESNSHKPNEMLAHSVGGAEGFAYTLFLLGVYDPSCLLRGELWFLITQDERSVAP